VISRLLLIFCLIPVAALASSLNRPVLSLVIDDLGYSFTAAKQVIDLPGNHSFSIIPGVTYSQKIAKYANSQNKEILLHLPMQSSDPTGPEEMNSLNIEMSEQQVINRVNILLKTFPNIKGINNHMGSRLTALDFYMKPVMESIKKYNNSLYFLDSRTTPLSRAYQVALNSGLNTLERDVFLDNEPNVESIWVQFNIWLNKSRKNGASIAIAHPHSDTIKFLNDNISRFTLDYEFRTISELIAINNPPRQEKQSWPKYLSHLHQGLKILKQ